ncbi:hypothetical protein WJX73_001034 [Symbiochloris irregularis]|uniref:Glycosyl transferase family 1 domain-containing protein n=1 Tax=Symbiochloris irregularis TaxID=706552 RepID=A0AAW1PUE4_9CHLO
MFQSKTRRLEMQTRNHTCRALFVCVLLAYPAQLRFAHGAEGFRNRKSSAAAAHGREQAALLAAEAGTLGTHLGGNAEPASARLLTAGLADPFPEPTAANPYKVCIMTADFWGLKNAGGTATAYHLMASVLAKHPGLQVTMVQITERHKKICDEGTRTARHGFKIACPEKHHYEPEVAESLPFEKASHAALAWLRQNQDKCDVVHGHEWGGVFVSVITALHFRQLPAGLRFVVETHGGHIWSQLGESLHPVDAVQLRIDNAERMANQLNDIEISPTKYMLSYLRQRGWKLPDATLTIPNVLPEMEGGLPSEKPVWRIAFFSRLEERKGIRMFIEAVNLLKPAKWPRFEVSIVGAESVIDTVPSSKWLAAKTANWTAWKTIVRTDAPRDEALDIISAPGTLVVLCSGVDNMPYVVAEAAAKGIPMLVCDTGGVLELFDDKQYRGNVVYKHSAAALAERIGAVLEAGKVPLVRLREQVMHGRTQWLRWHLEWATRRTEFLQADRTLEQEAQAASKHPAQVIQLQEGHLALDAWRSICSTGMGGQREDALLLMPPGYQLLNEGDNLALISRLLWLTQRKHDGIGALTFGTHLPNNRVAFASSPSYMYYDGDHEKCMDLVPIALSRESFCRHYQGDARVFRLYAPWILAMFLEHAHKQVHSFPQVLFNATNWTMTGRANCAMDSAPQARVGDYRRAAFALFRDADEMLREELLGSEARPLVSYEHDLTTAQGHKGWQYGYAKAGGGGNLTLQPLEFVKGASDLAQDGQWSCPLPAGQTEGDMFPWVRAQQIHPCTTGHCCYGPERAAVAVQLTSFFYAPEAKLVLSWEAFTMCGDGIDITATFRPAAGGPTQELVKQSHDPVSEDSKPQRHRIEHQMDFAPGDQILLVVDPRQTQDCDGVYVAEFKIWPKSQDS